MTFTALVLPFICNPLTVQPFDLSRNYYEHFIGLDLADSADIGDTLKIDLLIGSDIYWSLATGKVIKGSSNHFLYRPRLDGFHWVL